MRVPDFRLLLISGYELFGLALCLDPNWGGPVDRTLFRIRLVAAVGFTALAAGLYIAITHTPWQIRPWGFTATLWSAVNLVWILLFWRWSGDYSLIVSAWVTTWVFVAAHADLAGVPIRLALLITAVSIFPVPFVTKGFYKVFQPSRRIGWHVYPFSESQAVRKRFFHTVISRAMRRRNNILLGVGKSGLARLELQDGNQQSAVELMTGAIHAFEQAKRRSTPLRCWAFLYLSTWAWHDDPDNGEAAVDMAVALGHDLVRGTDPLTRALLLRGYYRMRRGEPEGALSDVDEADQILRRHKNEELSKMASELRAALAAFPSG
jgi:hypothetical protein